MWLSQFSKACSTILELQLQSDQSALCRSAANRVDRQLGQYARGRHPVNRSGLTSYQKVLLVLSERKHGPMMMVGDRVSILRALTICHVKAARPRARSNAMKCLSHSEIHLVHRIGWLRAAVREADDGFVLTASLVVGVVAAGVGKPEVLIAWLAGLLVGAMFFCSGR